MILNSTTFRTTLFLWTVIGANVQAAFLVPRVVRRPPTQQQQRQQSTAGSVMMRPTSSLYSLKPPEKDTNQETDLDSAAALAAAEEAAFLAHCKELCDERNIPFEKIKNARDLASCAGSPVIPGRIFRLGRVSDATDHDLETLFGDIKMQTLVDLRSPTELKDDPTLMREEVFHDFTNLVWKERGGGKEGCLKELGPGERPVRERHHKHDDDEHDDDHPQPKRRFWHFKSDKHEAEHHDEEPVLTADEPGIILAEDEELCTLDCDEEEDGDQQQSQLDWPANGERRKERHFVSLMNEFKYVKGTVSKVRKRDITKAILKSPGAVFSKRVRSSCKKPFLDEINGGGLPMLNELLLRFGAPGIKYVLELCADRNRHPIGFYCTAGKDRTGMIAAIILGLCGVKQEDIVEDYTLSANVYAEMNDHQAMVGALSQRSLDPKTFLGAPAHVMRDTLAAIDEHYGSVEGYCNWIGFGPEQQQKLKDACMKQD